MELRTSYLGLDLAHPIVASASPLSRRVENIRAMEDAGAAAVVLYSLFEEQIRQERAALAHYTEFANDTMPESLSFFPDTGWDDAGGEHYLELIREAVAAVDIPVIGSLNGVSRTGWIDYGRKIAEAGANAIELNIYYIAANPTVSGREVEDLTVDITRELCASLPIPVAVKLSSNFSALAHMTTRLQSAGADGLVLFNRFYQPDFNLETREVDSRLKLSSPDELRLPLRWIGLLRPHLQCNLAASTGVHTAEDVVKMLMAGADVVMSTSAILKNGIGHFRTLREGLESWMAAHDYQSVAQLRGCMSQANVPNADAFARANYIKLLESFPA